jgi:hypothetical protein
MSEDITEEPLRPKRRKRPREEPDDLDAAYGEEPVLPPLVKAAGVIWIVFGCIMLLNMVATFFLIMIVSANQQGPNAAGQAGVAAGGAVCLSVVIGLFAAAFLFVGVQSVRGTAAGTTGNAIGSIVFGLLNFGGMAGNAIGGNIVAAAVGGLGGAMLLTAGVLALAGGSQYKLWRKSQKDQQRREADERKARRRKPSREGED